MPRTSPRLFVTTVVAIAASITLTSADAQGLKFEDKTIQRFEESKDSKVGDVLIDRVKKLRWMRCAVDQTLDPQGGKECKGAPKEVTYQQAVAFAGSVGGGWRLPSLFEIQSAEGHLRRVLAQGKLYESRGSDLSGNWSCGYQGFWTSTAVTGDAEKTAAAQCREFSTGSQTYTLTVPKFGDLKLSIILVRDGR